ncbi:Uncharacterised protein [Bordetella pertussis]|nr:Uncharacterised protein [Bordetella pertussis]
MECRIRSRPSASLAVTMASCASLSMRKLVSTSRGSAPSKATRPASAALASPAPMDCATSATVTGPGYWRCEPSGKVICTIEGIPGFGNEKRGCLAAFCLVPC